VTWGSAQVIALRHRLGATRDELARITGTNLRTVSRWETGTCEPSGAALGVLQAIREKLDTDPANAERVVAFILQAARVGGLSYLLLKLLDRAVPRAAPRASPQP
jgi:transcriptional regulator with XRE-family HTH domain